MKYSCNQAGLVSVGPEPITAEPYLWSRRWLILYIPVVLILDGAHV